jgi:hypothetical protein
MAALSQLITVAYPEVLADARKPHNQWSESAFLRALEKSGAVKKRAGGASMEFPLDYRKNPDTDVLATDFTATATTQTAVLAGASYDAVPVAVPINWSLADEARTSGSQNQKIDFVKSLIKNAINSHDDEIETDIFSTSTDGFLGLANLVPTTGQPNVGGIDGASATYWRNYADTYQADGSDIEAAMTLAWNTTAKGSGSDLSPSIIVSGADAQATYEGQLQQFQRYMDGDKGNGGFEFLAFKNSKYVFSQRGSSKIYFLNPTSFNLVVINGYFRRLESAERFTNAAAKNQMVFSMVQACVNNPSRLAVLSVA